MVEEDNIQHIQSTETDLRAARKDISMSLDQVSEFSRSRQYFGSWEKLHTIQAYPLSILWKTLMIYNSYLLEANNIKLASHPISYIH